MFNYIVRRLLLVAITLTLISFVIYGLIRNMPGNPLTVRQSEQDPSRRISKEDEERMIKAYGLDKPWYVAYFTWINNVARLDLGRSISRKVAVTSLIAERMGPTLMLSSISLTLAYLLSVPLGLAATVRGGKLDERIGSTLLYMLYSFPSFVAALYLQLVLAVKLDLLPLFGMTSDDYASLSAPAKAWDILLHAILPVTCYTYGALAYEARFIRSNMEEVIRQDYIRTAKAKGVPPNRILLNHAFRNTMIPFVTSLGLTLPALLSGAVILEQVFNWPGMGTLFFDAIRERDYETVMGLTLMFSVLTLAGQLLADILYAVVDPRISYS